MSTSDVDLISIVSAYTTLRRESAASSCGPCPQCGGKDRLVVRNKTHRGKPLWCCRQCHEQWGDVADFYLFVGEATTMGEALKKAGSDPAPARTGPLPVRPPEAVMPPGQAWQDAAAAFVAECEAALWSGSRDGRGALTWLHRRGLTDDTIRRGRLGYNARSGNGRGPVGVTIPAVIDGAIWYVKTRRRDSDLAADPDADKYIHRAGCSAVALYNADTLQADRPAIMVESELDALALGQVAGDLVTAVAVGTARGAERAAWLIRLAVPSALLVALDADDAGDKAAPYWLARLATARRWRPAPYKDPGELLQRDGADALRAWVAAGLADGDAGELGDVCDCGQPVDRYTADGRPMCAACYAQALAGEAA